MKKIRKWISDLFEAGDYQDISLDYIVDAFNDPSVRSAWLQMVVDEIRAINMEVDRRLLNGLETGLIDLCAKRRTYQDILNFVVSAKKTVKQTESPNLRHKSLVDLDRVTA